MRVVVAGLPVGVREGLGYERVPWDRFAHANGSAADVPELLEGLRSGDAAVAGDCLSSLVGSVCHQGTRYAPAALAVPFLLRIAADRTAHPRVGVLFLVAEAARDGYGGAAPQAGLLRVGGDHTRFDTGAYREDWTVRAARAAIAVDAHIPIALLDDPDPRVRMGAAYVLSAAAQRAERISAALHESLRGESDPRVCAGLILAIAQLAHQHQHQHHQHRDRDRDAAVLARAHWSDPAHPLVVRTAAALAWLGLVDDPVPTICAPTSRRSPRTNSTAWRPDCRRCGPSLTTAASERGRSCAGCSTRTSPRPPTIRRCGARAERTTHPFSPSSATFAFVATAP
ncbi:HEAT repeat domain-containing protein [Embleya hyalina]|uniref:Uncharacterized protein n=1 Tax=Embleya hyalina TaxID=516124 RepID=A0A401YWV0_9ACTN|nr:HEAT repeat domain-containing protein [Embleya hyalina]GCD99078.1 hypothetical protein EHYA_06790 [Embleya hyalina]